MRETNMKIVSQSSDEMVLQEGSSRGLAIGILWSSLACWWPVLHSTKPMALWIGLGAVALGAGVICFASSITVGATKSKDQLVYQKKRIVRDEDRHLQDLRYHADRDP